MTLNATDSEVILKIRETMDVVRHDTALKEECMINVDQLYRKYMKKRNGISDTTCDSEIHFPYTGKCTLKYDKRK